MFDSLKGGKDAEHRANLQKSEQSSQTAPPSYTPAVFQSTFASVSLHKHDTIRFLRFPQQDIEALRGVIHASWPKGIQEERLYGGSHEIKLRGYPWGEGYSGSDIKARILMREVFAHLFSVGWILHISTDVSKKEYDKDTMIFRKQATPPPSEWVSISFHRADRLRLGGASNAMITSFRGMLQGMHKLQSEEWKDQSLNAYEFKILGNPWLASGEETMEVRILILGMLETLERDGWSLYASVDQCISSQNISSADTWYCVRDKSWAPGGVVFHR